MATDTGDLHNAIDALADGPGQSFNGAGNSGFKLKWMVTAISAALSVRQILDYSDA